MDSHAHARPNYIKIWALLLGLLVVSVLGPMVGIKIVTLICAFGIAVVKAYLVAKNFMHLNIEQPFIKFILGTMVAFMVLLFAGISPDVMKHQGSNWDNVAAQGVVQTGLRHVEHGVHEGRTLALIATREFHDDLTAKRGTAGAGISLEQLRQSSPAAVAQGKQLFMTTCSTCHGVEGKGDGIAAAALNPRPRNFQSPDGWKNGRKATQLFATLQHGIPPGMPPFDTIPASNRLQLIHFVRSLGPTPPQDTASDLAAFETAYHLSAGEKTPNQISIARAVTLIAQDEKPRRGYLRTVADVLARDNDHPIFRESVDDTRRAVLALGSSDGWRGNPSEFSRYILAGIPDNGFRPQVAHYGTADWQALHSLLERSILKISEPIPNSPTEAAVSSDAERADLSRPSTAVSEGLVIGAQILGDADAGKAIFQKYCVACHGEKGDGNGPAGIALNPRPANFTDHAHMSTRSDQDLMRIIKDGGPAVGLSPLMAPWGGVLSEQQAKDVTTYVRSFSR